MVQDLGCDDNAFTFTNLSPYPKFYPKFIRKISDFISGFFVKIKVIFWSTLKRKQFLRVFPKYLFR